MTTTITRKELEVLTAQVNLITNAEILIPATGVAKLIALINEWEPLMRGVACSNGPYDRPCCQARQSLGRFDAKTK